MSEYAFNRRTNSFSKKQTRTGVDYDAYATKTWSLLVSFFRWYPDILHDICEGEHCQFHLSLPQRVTLRYMARYSSTFTFGSRGFSKTTCVVASRCDDGILWPGSITGYYAPVEKQAAPLASKAFADYSINYPLLAAHWRKDSDAQDRFQLSTKNGSKFIMDIDRGVDTSCIVAEECGQEDKNPFNWADMIQVVLPTNRKQHYVDGAPDKTHIDNQEHYITSASSKENEAFSTCKKIRQEMRNGESAYAMFVPWQVVVLSRMKPVSYYMNQKKRMTAEQFMRECETKCTGSVDNPIIPDRLLEDAKKIKVMEDKHCGDPDVFYVLGYDVASRDAAGNALSATAVLKCERQYDAAKCDKYLKSLVYVNDMRPLPGLQQARELKKRWWDYCLPEIGQYAYLAIDGRNIGEDLIETLHSDLGDGLPPLCTVTHEYLELEQPDAIPCIYPIRATGNNGGNDQNIVMIEYLQKEFETENVRLLITNSLEGCEAYKLAHEITDDYDDPKIQFPYLRTKELCRQIGNLQRRSSTAGYVLRQVSSHIQKDMWSAFLYAARMVHRLEKAELYDMNRRENETEKEAEAVLNGTYVERPRREPGYGQQFGGNQQNSGYVIHPRAVRRQGRLAIK